MNPENIFHRRKNAQEGAKMERGAMMRFFRETAQLALCHRRIFSRIFAPSCGPLILR